PVTAESLITAAPDAILMMTGGLESVGGVDGFVQIPGIKQTPAGKNRRIIDMDDSVLLSYGPSTGHVIHALTDALYGDRAQCPRRTPPNGAESAHCSPAHHGPGRAGAAAPPQSWSSLRC